MRDLLTKIAAGSMVAGAALLVAACGGSESANTVENTTVTTMDETMGAEGTTNDVMSIDAANNMSGGMAADSNMTMDANMTTNSMSGNSMSGNMMSNSMGNGMMNTTTTTTNTSTTNAM